MVRGWFSIFPTSPKDPNKTNEDNEGKTHHLYSSRSPINFQSHIKVDKQPKNNRRIGLLVSIEYVRSLGVATPSKQQAKTEQTEKSATLFRAIREVRSQGKPLPTT